MHSRPTHGQDTPNATPLYPPSVPLAVYRELLDQLQTAEATLDFLNAQNQQLARQNHQLKQEIAKAVESVLHLRQFVEHAPQTTTYSKSRNYRPITKVHSSAQGLPLQSRHGSYSAPEKLVIEQAVGRYRRRSPSANTAEINGWYLAIVILLIILTAFGAGYMIVRPLLTKR